MASTPTKNSVPSENYNDLRFNAGKLDEFVTSSDDEYTDRLGVTHLTARGLQNSVAGALLPANNLSDVASKDTSLSNLGGGTAGIAVFKGATPAAIRATLSAAASGDNTDITSLSGLTTALSLTQGGTGSNTAAGARTNLGLGSIATQNGNLVSITGGSVTGITDLAIADGGTGASTAAAARTNLGAAASGANTDITSLAGVTDASNAAAGKVGEYLSNSASAVAMTSGTATNLTSVTLTPGDWDVHGTAEFTGSAAVITNNLGGFNTVSATLPTFPNRWRNPSSAVDIVALAVPYQRISVSANTTVYLVSSVTFGSGTVTGAGAIRARRAR